MYSSTMTQELVIHPVKDNKEVLSDKKMFLQEINSIILAYKAQEDSKEDLKILKVETKTITKNYSVVGQMTPLDIMSIALRDKRESV